MNAFVHFIVDIIAHCERFVNIGRTVFRTGNTNSEELPDFALHSAKYLSFRSNISDAAQES